MSDRINWNIEIVESKLQEMRGIVNSMEGHFADVKAFSFSSNEGGPIPSLMSFNAEIAKNIQARINYMNAMIQVIESQKNDVVATDENVMANS